MVITATVAKPAASQKITPTEKRVSSSPPTAKPTICITPTETFMAERASTYRPVGTTSESRPQRTPPPIESTYAAPKTIISRPSGGRSTRAWTAKPIAIRAETAERTSRGGAVSASDIRVPAPITCTSDGPNMTSAVSSGDPVSACTTSPRPRLDMVVAAVPRALPVHNARNSRCRNRAA